METPCRPLAQTFVTIWWVPGLEVVHEPLSQAAERVRSPNSTSERRLAATTLEAATDALNLFREIGDRRGA